MLFLCIFFPCTCAFFFFFYPCGSCDAPICCPGASTWQTTKCLVISCMSSLLKKVLKQSLSAGGEEIIRGGAGWQDRNMKRKKHGEGAGGERVEECDRINYTSHSERTLKVAIWTSDPVPGAEGSSQQITCQTTCIHSCEWQLAFISLWNRLVQ